MTPAIAVASLRKHYGQRAILDGLDWQVERGQVIGLLGRNGAGKSTMLECLLGVRPVDSGSVRLLGDDVSALSSAVRAHIGYVPQSSDLFAWQTPRQMLAYFRTLYPRWNQAKVASLLQRWGFEGGKEHTLIGELSGGERQRLSIIRALAHEPALLVLDEPASALDSVARRDFLRELIDTVVARDTTVVFSTHILTDLERVALDVAVLKDGKIALQGALDNLLEHACRLSGPTAMLAPVRLDGELRRSVNEEGWMEIVAAGGGADAHGLAAGNPALRVHGLSLEEIFAEVTQ